MSRENGKRQTGVKRPRQRVAKESVAETALAAKRLEEPRKLEEAGRIGKPVLATRNPGGGEKQESQGGLGCARRTGEPMPIAKDLEREEKQESQGELEGEEGTKEPALAVGDPEVERDKRGSQSKWQLFRYLGLTIGKLSL